MLDAVTLKVPAGICTENALIKNALICLQLTDTLLLGEIDATKNHIPAGPPVGGEHIDLQ